MTENGIEGRTIRSDERLFDIIELLHTHDEIGVTAIANELDLAKSTVHGHLTSMRRRGYAVRTDNGYRLGLEFLNNGKHVQSNYELYSLSNRKVKQLATETGELTWCTVEENGLGYYLTGAKGDHPVDPPARVGTGLYLHPLAGGKAILANLPNGRIEEIIDRHGLPEMTSNTITSKDELYAELETVREQGYAVNDEESLSGLYAIGAPIVDENDIVRGALSIAGPTNRLKTADKQRSLIELLLGATNELEINIGNHSSM